MIKLRVALSDDNQRLLDAGKTAKAAFQQAKSKSHSLRFRALFLAGLMVLLPEGRAEDWKVMWKDDMQELKVDRDSVRVQGSQVEYWYSDTVDAIVDWMEHRYYAVSDCAANRMRLTQVYDPITGQTKPVKDSEWKEKPYDPDDPVTVMHDEICRHYGRWAS